MNNAQILGAVLLAIVTLIGLVDTCLWLWRNRRVVPVTATRRSRSIIPASGRGNSLSPTQHDSITSRSEPWAQARGPRNLQTASPQYRLSPGSRPVL